MTDDQPPVIESADLEPERAYLTGMVQGIAAQHGVALEPELDAAGNYTGRLKLPPDERDRVAGHR